MTTTHNSTLRKCPSRRHSLGLPMQKLCPFLRIVATLAANEIVKVFLSVQRSRGIIAPYESDRLPETLSDVRRKSYAHFVEWPLLLPRSRYSRYFGACDDHIAQLHLTKVPVSPKSSSTQKLCPFPRMAAALAAIENLKVFRSVR